MLKIKKDMLSFDDGIKDRLDFIVKYTNNIATFENGNVITIEKPNFHYVEPHRMSIKNHLFLFFNYDDNVYYKTLDTKIELKNLKTFIENLD